MDYSKPLAGAKKIIGSKVPISCGWWKGKQLSEGYSNS